MEIIKHGDKFLRYKCNFCGCECRCVDTELQHGECSLACPECGNILKQQDEPQIPHNDLMQTVDLMNSPDHKDRLKAEYWQLKIRLNKLADMLSSYYSLTSGGYGTTHTISVLEEQFTHMKHYMNSLKDHAQIEGIRLDDIPD